MAFRTLNTRVPSSIVKRAYSSQTTPQGAGLVSPFLNELPRPILGEYRAGVPAATGARTAPRAAKVTTLSNGLKVATLSSTDLGVSLGLFVGVGPRHESRHTAGSSHFLKFAAFNSNKTRPGYQVVREVEANGATLTASVGREHLLFSSEAANDSASAVVPLLSELLSPRLPYHEVAASQETVAEEINRVEHDVVASLLENLHKQAYRNKGLGQSLTARKDTVHHINYESLSKFVDAHYTADNAVFVGVGVEHDTLVNSVQAALQNNTSKKQTGSSEPSKYVGGESLVAASGETHFALAFEGASLRSDSKDALAFGVIQHILGNVLAGAHVPSAIGFGSTSRLANAINSNPSANALAAFNFSYSDSGLFGVYGEAKEAPGKLVQSVVAELGKLSNISAAELNKGKALYKFSVLEQGSKRIPALEFIGQQVLSSGKAITPEEYAAQIDSLTAEDVSKAAKKAFASRPTFVVIGDVSNLPSSEEIRSALSK